MRLFGHGTWRPSLRVICVDDSRDVADSTATLLKLVGFDAQACYDGPSAIQLFQTFRPDLCLIDLNMPGMEGDELALRLREESRVHPLVLVALTARSTDEADRRIKAAGFDLHLVKPVKPQKLIQIVHVLFHRAPDTDEAKGSVS